MKLPQFPGNRWTIGWATIVGAGVAWELLALATGHEEGTLTAHIRAILSHDPISFTVAVILAAVAFKHLFIDGRNGNGKA